MIRRVVLSVLFVLTFLTPVSARLPHGGVCSSNCSAPAGLTNMTVVETTGSTVTNAAFSIGVPFNAGIMDGSHHLQAVFDPTGANTTLTCDENNRYSDVATAVRGTTLSCTIPSLGANATKAIALSVVSGAPGSGTDIAISDITGTAYDLPLTIVTLAGTTETASPLTALNSGNSAWVNSTTAAVLGKWRSGGGIVTGYILYVPFKSGGGTADPKGLYAYFDVECYKSGTGAVSGGNPIRQCTTDVIIGNGVVENSDPLSSTIDFNGYSLQAGSGGACVNFPTTSPTQTLTFTNTAGQNELFTANSSLFSVNNVGNLIYEPSSGGYAVIYRATGSGVSATAVEAAIFKAFSGGTLTSGNYKIVGIQHPYGTYVYQRCGWTPGGGVAGPPALTVENNNVYLGDAWDNGALTGGPGVYMISSRALLNYNTAVNPGLSSVTNSPQSATQGSSPNGYGSVLNSSDLGNAVCAHAYYGDWQGFQQASGSYDGRGPNPATYIGAVLKYDSNAAASIWQDVAKFMTVPDQLLSNTTGVTPTTNTPNYVYNGLFVSGGGTLIATTGTSAFLSGGGVKTNCWDQWPNTAHAVDAFYIPYVMTGNWYVMNALLNNAWGLFTNRNPSYVGSGKTRVFMGTQGAADDQRGMFWPFLILGRAALLLPDSDTNSTPSPVLGYMTKTDALANLELQYTSTGTDGNYSHNPYPGINISLIGTSDGGSCPGGATCNPNYQANEFRFISTTSGYGFEDSYGHMALASLYEEGMLSTNGLRFWTWFAAGKVQSQVNSGISDPLWGAFIEHAAADTSGTTPSNACLGGGYQYTYTNVWKILINNCFVNGQVGLTLQSGLHTGRIPSGTATLSGSFGTPGASITVTLPTTGYLTAGNSYYAGLGTFFEAAPDNGLCQITSVADPVITCTVLAGNTFAHSSYNNASYNAAVQPNWSIPLAAPGDTNGLEVAGIKAAITSPNPAYDYVNLTQTALVLINNYLSVTSMATALTTANNLTGGTPNLYDPILWNIVHR